MRKKKEKITEIVLSNLKHIDTYANITVDKVLLRWWMTGRVSSGMRLTDEGKTCFEIAEIAHYDFDFNYKNKSPQDLILELNRKITCPYYIGVNTENKVKTAYLRLYDHKIAMMLSLYGNILEYLNSIKEKK
ncbi:hypothetical protein EBU91_00090 [bacterium]|nr:hypothetical protein [bacterium]